MLESPLILIGFFLIGGLTLSLLGRRQTLWLKPIAFGLTVSSLLLWFLLGRTLPQTVVLKSSATTFLAPNLQWQIDDATWALAGIILILLAGVLLFYLRSESHPLEPGFALLLAGSGLAVLWAGNIPTLMIAWTLMALVWLIALTNSESVHTNESDWIMKASSFLLPLFFLGLAAIIMPVDDLNEGFANANRFPTVSAAILLAALGLMGILPLQQWRPFSWALSPMLTPLMHLLPALAGAGLMVRLTDRGGFNVGIALTMTLFCLLTVLYGLQRAWSNFDVPSHSVAGVAMSVAGMAFLGGLWGNSAALVAMMRVYGFALGILFLCGEVAIQRNRLWRVAAPLVALMSLAGLPLTAGFAGLAPLYAMWLGNGRYLLILVMMLLLIPLATAVALLIRPQLDLKTIATQLSSTAMIRDLALILFIPGLFTTGDFAWGTLSPIIWLAILIPIIAGLLLPRVVSEPQAMMQSISAAFTPTFSWRRYEQPFFAVGRGLVAALSDAAHILQGEHGLAWLLLFLLIFVTAVAL